MNKGDYLKRDPHLEYLYMKRAAQAGLVEAQHNLGVMYLQGARIKPDSTGPTVDHSKALAWLAKISLGSSEPSKRGTPSLERTL
jgi:TPR repeat protein